MSLGARTFQCTFQAAGPCPLCPQREQGRGRYRQHQSGLPQPPEASLKVWRVRGDPEAAGVPGWDDRFAPEPGSGQLPVPPLPGRDRAQDTGPASTHAAAQLGSPAKELLLHAGDGVSFTRKVAAAPGPTSRPC